MVNPHRELQALIRHGDLLVNRYRIGRRVGAGAYGMIFRAVDETTGENVAVKAIPRGISKKSSTALARFQRELKVVRNLIHPNIISLYDWGQTEDGLIFMILEFIDGETLDKVVRGQPMSLDDAMDVARQLAMALQAAHAKGVIHRDLKPANVMLTRQRHGGFSVKVLDFGMAKVLSPMEDESIVDLTREGIAVGTPRYIAPEQARGLPVGPATDLYALGLLLYEMLTGVQAVQANSVQDAVAAHVARKPLELDEIERVPPVIRPLLYRLVEKDASRRVQAAADLITGLDEVLHRQESFFVGNSQPQLGPALGEMTGDYPGAGSHGSDYYDPGIQPGLDREEERKASLAKRLLGKEEKLELDYGRFKAYAKPEKDAVMRRRREYRGRWFRLPRTTGEGIEAVLTALLVPFSFLIVGAQAASLDFGLRLAIAAATPLIALIGTTLRHSETWEESFGRVGWLSCLGALIIAHLLGPNELATELTRNPTWFLTPLQELPFVGVLAEVVTWVSRHWAALLFRVF